jgi:hypothetical protein
MNLGPTRGRLLSAKVDLVRSLYGRAVVCGARFVIDMEAFAPLGNLLY